MAAAYAILSPATAPIGNDPIRFGSTRKVDLLQLGREVVANRIARLATYCGLERASMPS